MANDLLIDVNGDLLIQNGDFVIGNNEVQSAVLIVNTVQGAWKQFPLIGCGLKSYLGSDGQIKNLKRKIQIQMLSDGFTDVQVNIKQNGNEFNYSLTAEKNE
jgi:hypothetical protein